MHRAWRTPAPPQGRSGAVQTHVDDGVHATLCNVAALQGDGLRESQCARPCKRWSGGGSLERLLDRCPTTTPAPPCCPRLHTRMCACACTCALRLRMQMHMHRHDLSAAHATATRTTARQLACSRLQVSPSSSSAGSVMRLTDGWGAQEASPCRRVRMRPACVHTACATRARPPPAQAWAAHWRAV